MSDSDYDICYEITIAHRLTQVQADYIIDNLIDFSISDWNNDAGGLQVFTETDRRYLDCSAFVRAVFDYLKVTPRIEISETVYTPQTEHYRYDENYYRHMGFKTKFQKHKEKLLC
jgi:hypothetical protein